MPVRIASSLIASQPPIAISSQLKHTYAQVRA